MSRRNYNQRRFYEMYNQKEKQMTQRSKEAINNEYANVCAQIGERSFQVSMMEADIDALKKRVLELGKEIKAIDEAEKAAVQPVNAATAQPITEVGVPNANTTTTA